MMQLRSPLPAAPTWVRSLAMLGLFVLPPLIELECSLQSMLLFEGLFVALFLLPASIALVGFLKSRLLWARERTDKWISFTIIGNVVGFVFTLFYALVQANSSGPVGDGPPPATTAHYLTIAIGFPLIVGFFQLFVLGLRPALMPLWPLVLALASLISYGASQVYELTEKFDPTAGIITLVLTLATGILVSYWMMRWVLGMIKPTAEQPASIQPQGEG